MKITPLYTPPQIPRIFRSKPGEIGEGRSWCCVHDCYLYIGSSLVNLLWILTFEWKSDKHLVG